MWNPHNRYHVLRFICLALMLLAGSASTAMANEPEPSQQESIRPGINKTFLDPDLNVEEWSKRFQMESREVFTARYEVLKALKLSPGMTVADIGAGTGLFTTLFADAVGPEGWVYAVEIAPGFVAHLRTVAQDHGQKQVTPVLCDEDSVRLPPNSVDVAFTCDVYHHFEYPQSTLKSIMAALKPEGRLVIVDFERIPGVSREWTLDHVRADKQTVKQEIEQAGFQFLGETPIAGLKENYFIVFRKPAE